MRTLHDETAHRKAMQECWNVDRGTVEKRRLNEGLRDLWERSEVTGSDRQRLISDLLGERI